MTIREIIEMFVDENAQEFSVYDGNKEENVFHGTIDECPYADSEIDTIDNIYGSGELTFNIFE